MNGNRVSPPIYGYCGILWSCCSGYRDCRAYRVIPASPRSYRGISGYKAASFSAAVTWICLGLVLAVMTTRTVTGVPRAILAGILCVIMILRALNSR